MGRRREVLEDRCEELATALRNQGESFSASFLGEAIPAGPISSDDHLTLLTQRLDAVATNSQLSLELRTTARALAAAARDLPSAIGRRGRAFVVWFEDSRTADESPALEHVASRYACSWQPFRESDDDDPLDHDLYEDGPWCENLSDALAWAQRRTDWITVRPEWDSGTHYWAGIGPTMEGEPPLILPSS